MLMFSPSRYFMMPCLFRCCRHDAERYRARYACLYFHAAAAAAIAFIITPPPCYALIAADLLMLLPLSSLITPDAYAAAAFFETHAFRLLLPSSRAYDAERLFCRFAAADISMMPAAAMVMTLLALMRAHAAMMRVTRHVVLRRAAY